MSPKKICVLGLDQSGIPLSAVIALKCPEIRVTVVQKNSEFVYIMNTGQIPGEVFVPGIEELIRKCQNKNLFFTTNDKNAIKEADIVFIMSKSKFKEFGEGKQQTVDLSMIEDAACVIAENAETSKIVVESSPIPLKAAECVSNILRRNGKPRIEFEVLSNPEFYEQGSPLRDVLNLEFMFIGSENTSKGLEAAKQLAGVYERWIPSENIIIGNIWSTELSKMCASALMAQLYSSIQSLSIICEEMGGDVTVCKDIIGREKKMGSEVLSTCFNVGKLPSAVRNLVYLCESYNFTEAADYWRQVLEMFNFNKFRFFKNLIWKINGTMYKKRIVLLGFTSFKDTEVTEGSMAVDLCSWLLNENCFVNIYDIRISKKVVVDAVMGSDSEKTVEAVERLVMVFDDPYEAVQRCQAIVLCSPWLKFAKLDFTKIFNDMEKPAYIFDTALILPHSHLIEIGFEVYAYGKSIEKLS